MPFWLPTNSRPPATSAATRRKSRRESRTPTSATASAPVRRSARLVRPAGIACSCASGDQPGQDDWASTDDSGGDGAVQRPTAAPVISPPSGLPLEIFRDRAALGAAQASALRTHAAGGQRGQDGFGRSLAEDFGFRRARSVGAVVARRAVAREDRRAVGCLRRGHQPRRGGGADGRDNDEGTATSSAQRCTADQSPAPAT